MNRTKSPAIVGLLALLLAACGGSPASESAAASDDEAPSVAATPEPAASEAPESDAPEPSADDGDGSGTGSDSDLADLLPATLGGVARQDIDLSSNPMFSAALAEQGLDPDEIDFLIASYGTVGVTAMRIPELGQPELEQLARIMSGMPEAQGSVEEMTVGGKTVLAITATEAGQTGYMYFAGDAVFVIGGGSEEQAAEILEQLP